MTIFESFNLLAHMVVYKRDNLGIPTVVSTDAYSCFYFGVAPEMQAQNPCMSRTYKEIDLILFTWSKEIRSNSACNFG